MLLKHVKRIACTYRMKIQIQTRMISYWSKLISGKSIKLANLLYKASYQINENSVTKISWIENIKQILNYCGLSNIWLNQSFPNKNWLKSKVKLTLIDQFKQSWESTVENSPKSLNYRIFKEELKFENYLNILSKKDAITLLKFRICNHHLPIEKGRWQNISRENRICDKCNLNEIGDEFHRKECKHYYYIHIEM